MFDGLKNQFSPGILAVAWILVGFAGITTFSVYNAIPEPMPVLFTLFGDPIRWEPKSPLMALRLPMIGLAQVGTFTAMWREARTSKQAGWGRVWQVAALAFSCKILIQCISYALPVSSLWSRLSIGATIAIVMAFIYFLQKLRKQGVLAPLKPIRLSSLAILVVTVLLWFFFAGLPGWT